MKLLFRLLPVALFALLVVLLGRGLQLEPGKLPSALVDGPAPDFRLSRLDAPQTEFSPAAMQGQVWLLNVWASWCAPCREELPTLKALSAHVPIVGLNYKDAREQGLDWLGRFGNPYRLSVHDVEGKVGIDYGVYGVPETFVIDKQGVVRLRLTGPVTPELVRDQLLPLVSELSRG